MAVALWCSVQVDSIRQLPAINECRIRMLDCHKDAKGKVLEDCFRKEKL